MLKRLLVGSLALLALSATTRQNDPNQKEWLQLFNGRDLNDWVIKFAGSDLGVNVNETFRVEDGLLEVRYDKWTTFEREFGRIASSANSFPPRVRRAPGRNATTG
jgi:hypothetical protein